MLRRPGTKVLLYSLRKISMVNWAQAWHEHCCALKCVPKTSDCHARSRREEAAHLYKTMEMVKHPTTRTLVQKEKELKHGDLKLP